MANKTVCIAFTVFSIVAIFASTCVLVLYLLELDNIAICEGKDPVMVIDQDGGADDAMAVFMALIHEKYYNGPKVILTTTHGNVNESQAYYNAQFFLQIANRSDVPIYRGAKRSLLFDSPSDHYFGHDGIGDNDFELIKHIQSQPEHAVVALVELSKKHEGQLTVVAIGPLTNIALAMRLDPEFLARLKHLYVGAGNVVAVAIMPIEFNAKLDVEAYEIVGDNKQPEKVTFVPYSQALFSTYMSMEWRNKVIGMIPTKTIEFQNKFERAIDKEGSWVLLDPIVMSIVINSSVIQEQYYTNNTIVLCGSDRGMTQTDLKKSPEGANGRVVYAMNKDVYKYVLYEMFSTEIANI